MAAVLIGTTTASIRTAGPARAEDPATDPVPVLDRWTSTAQVWQDPTDGTLSATLYAGPVQAPDPTSPTGWSPIDTDLAMDPTGGITTLNTDAAIELSSGEPGPLASVSRDGQSLSVGWEGDLPAPVLAGDVATYSGVLTGVDAIVDANPEGFEVSFVVASAADAPASVDLPLALEGLSASLSPEGGLVLADGEGAVVGGAEPALMWGAALDPATGEPAVRAPVPTALVEGPDGPILRLTPDPAFFADPAVGFPVTLDPAVNLSVLVDTYADSSEPSTGHGSEALLRMGRGVLGAVYRSFVGFDPSPISGRHVLSASLSLYETHSASCLPSQFDLYSVEMASWPPPAPLTWNNQPAPGSLYASATEAKGFAPLVCPAGPVTLSIGGTGGATLTELVQAWASGAVASPAVQVRARDEGGLNSYKEFRSTEAGTGIPSLSVTYNSYPNAPTGLSALTDPVTGAVTLHGTFSDPDPGATGHVQYAIYDIDGALVSTSSGSTVSSGGDSTYAVPSAMAPDWDSYTWKARSWDGIDYSNYASAVFVRQSGIWGGGFINVIAPNPVSPTSPSPILAGGDDSGIHGLGDTQRWGWSTSNDGLYDKNQLTIASIVHTGPGFVPSRAYAAYGAGTPDSSGVLVYESERWTPVPPCPLEPCSKPTFNGLGPDGDGPYADQCEDCPRATGSLLVPDERTGQPDGAMWAGTYGGGVWRFDGSVWDDQFSLV